MAQERRPRAATEEKRKRILDATEEIMLKEGYAAVSSRSVATAVGHPGAARALLLPDPRRPLRRRAPAPSRPERRTDGRGAGLAGTPASLVGARLRPSWHGAVRRAARRREPPPGAQGRGRRHRPRGASHADGRARHAARRVRHRRRRSSRRRSWPRRSRASRSPPSRTTWPGTTPPPTRRSRRWIGWSTPARGQARRTTTDDHHDDPSASASPAAPPRSGRSCSTPPARWRPSGTRRSGSPITSCGPSPRSIAGQAVADATTTLRITQTVLAQDFREPAVLAKELATLDVLSEGRLQVGLGAGWLRQEYEDASIRFDSASVRIERLEETAIILKGLFGDEPFSFEGEHYAINELKGTPTPVQRPRPPIMIGGGGQKLLSVAARQADIVQLMPSNRGGGTGLDPSQFSAPAIEEKIGWIRDAAGTRFDEIELSAQLLECVVTDRPDEHLSRLRRPDRHGHRADGRGPDRPRRRRPADVADRRRRVARRGVRAAGRHPRPLRHHLLRGPDRRQARGARSGHRGAGRPAERSRERADVLGGARARPTPACRRESSTSAVVPGGTVAVSRNVPSSMRHDDSMRP